MTSDTTLLDDVTLHPQPFRLNMQHDQDHHDWSQASTRLHQLPSHEYSFSSSGTSFELSSDHLNGSPSSPSTSSENYGLYRLGTIWNSLEPSLDDRGDIHINTMQLPLSQPLDSPSYSTTPQSQFHSHHPPMLGDTFFVPQLPPLSPSGQSSNTLFYSPYAPLPHTPPVTATRSPSAASLETFPSESDAGSPNLAHGSQSEDAINLYTHKEQYALFKDANNLPRAHNWGPMIPQAMYRPHTNSDRRRYVEEAQLEPPINFFTDGNICGISLSDALHSRVKKLHRRDETVFQDRGPSVSIRLEWPGYRQWSRQIPTKDFRSPPGPITRAKLAKNVAKCVERFIKERQNHALEDESDPRWRVGDAGKITLDNLILVSLHHVSMGSWQPQLRVYYHL